MTFEQIITEPQHLLLKCISGSRAYNLSLPHSDTDIKGIISVLYRHPLMEGVNPLATMYFNKDGYSTYCREYGEYWIWVEERNDERYQNTKSHGKNYDAKNMMHTFRLLNMAEEIAVQHKVIVHRNDRDFLLRIRAGDFEYEELIRMVEEKMIKIEEAYCKSDLPETPDIRKAEDLLVRIREGFYE